MKTSFRNIFGIANTAMILLVLVLSGCSNKKKTSAQFKINLSGISSLASFSTGGGMLYGRGSTGRSFGMRLDTFAGETITIELDNGTWDFYALTWDGDHDLVANAPVPLTGKVYCSDIKGIQLSGGDLGLNLNLTQAGCNKPDYAPSFNANPVLTFPEQKFKSCRGNVFPMIIDQNDPDCDNDYGAGYYSSIQVILAPHVDGIPNIAEAIKGPCMAVTSTANSNLTATAVAGVVPKLNIPSGSAATPFFTILRGFYGTETCDEVETRGFFDRVFVNGLHQPNRTLSFLYDNSGTQTVMNYIDTEDPALCSGDRLTSSANYAFGTVNSYWKGICSFDQLDLLRANYSTDRTKNFVLLKNLNKYSGWAPPAPPPSVSPFDMIGEDPVVQPTDGLSFLGKFDGNNKAIVGIEIDYDSDSVTRSGFGMFRHLGTNGVIKNLTLIFPEIETHYRAHSKVGSVVGFCDGGQLFNVKVKLGRVKGFQDVGGIIGRAQNCVLNYSSFEEGSVSGTMGIGGLIGYSDGTNFLQDRFDGIVEKNHGGDGYCSNPSYFDQAQCVANSATWNISMHFGGAAGVCSSGLLSEVATHGTVSGNVKVGGLCGNHTSATVNDSYSLANVIATGLESGASYAGGLFGAVDWGSVQRSFHAVGTITGFGTSVDGLYGFMGGGPSPLADNLSLMKDMPAGITYNLLRNSAYGGYTNFDKVSVWIFDDDGYDVPRLRFEPPRYCNGKFAGTFGGGNGSTSAPYIICSAAQLANIANYFDIGANFILMNDIDISPIAQDTKAIISKAGDPNAGFSGVFNGNGKNINNFVLNNENVDTVIGPLGLFSNISTNGKVKDFHVWVQTFNSDYASSTYSSGVISGLNSGIVRQVTAFGKMRSVHSQATGGLVGVNQGMIIGSSSHMVMEASFSVGGIAGINQGGIIYSESTASLYPSTQSSMYVGGIAGKNQSGTPVTFYDDYEGINRTFEGTIIESEYRGLASNNTFQTNNVRGLAYYGGMAGFNSGTIIDSKVDAKVYLGNGIIYKGTWDATTADPTIGPLEAFVVSNTGATILGSVMSWATGDLMVRTDSGYFKLDTPNFSGLITSSTTIHPVMQFGSIAGYNASGALVERVVANSNYNYTSPQASTKFSQFTGHAFGYDASASGSDNILMASVNTPGTPVDDLISGKFDVFFQGATFAKLNFLELASTASAGVINTVSDWSANVFTNDYIHVGNVMEQVASVGASTITVTNGGLSFGSSTALFHHDTSAIIDYAYLSTLGFDAGTDHDLFIWTLHGSNQLPGLNGPEGYRHFGNEPYYYQIMQQYQ